MSREFPDWINPWSAAEGRRIFRGTLPLKWLRRLSGLLAADDGAAEFRAAFFLDTDHRPVIELSVSAELPLLCQASLEPYRETVTRKTTLAVVAAEHEIATLPGHYEPVIAHGGRLALADLVEDELLLGMPQVPRRPGLEWVIHEAGETTPAEGEGDSRKPFAGLDELLRRQRGTH